MKNTIHILLFMVLAQSAFAADFRVIDFGESCGEIEDREKSTGSIKIKSNTHLYSYKDNHLDREAEIMYICDDVGNFKRGMYMYTFSNLPEAQGFYKITKPILQNELGKPTIDSKSEIYSKVMSELGFETTEEDKFTASWQKDGTQILLYAAKVSAHTDKSNVVLAYSNVKK